MVYMRPAVLAGWRAGTAGGLFTELAALLAVLLAAFWRGTVVAAGRGLGVTGAGMVETGALDAAAAVRGVGVELAGVDVRAGVTDDAVAGAAAGAAAGAMAGPLAATDPLAHCRP
jgi:hypothetical protein